MACQTACLGLALLRESFLRRDCELQRPSQEAEGDEAKAINVTTQGGRVVVRTGGGFPAGLNGADPL